MVCKDGCCAQDKWCYQNCVNLKPPNERIHGEVHPLPKVDETLDQLTGTKIFSKLVDFYKSPLNRVQDILHHSSPPSDDIVLTNSRLESQMHRNWAEHLQNCMCQILEGVLCQMNNELVFGKDQEQYGTRLTAVLGRIQTAEVTLNQEKSRQTEHQITVNLCSAYAGKLQRVLVERDNINYR